MSLIGSGNFTNHPTKADKIKAIEKKLTMLKLERPSIIYVLPMKELNTVEKKLEREAIKVGLMPEIGI